MNTNVTEAGPFEKLLTLQVPEADLEAAKSSAARRLSHDLKIKGFRPGKAPRRIVEATVGPERLRSEAIDDLLPSLVADALRGADLNPAVPPQVENMKDIDDGLEVEVKIATWPELDHVPAYEALEVEVSQPEPTEEELERQLTRLRDQFADLEPAERPAVDGDFVSINLSATRDGAPVEEAAANDPDADRLLAEARAIADRCVDPGIAGRYLARVEARHGHAERAVVDELVEELSDRELAVLRYLPSKLSQREIAGELYVSLNTVKTHSKAIYRKLAVDGRHAAVQSARDLGLL